MGDADLRGADTPVTEVTDDAPMEPVRSRLCPWVWVGTVLPFVGELDAVSDVVRERRFFEDPDPEEETDDGGELPPAPLPAMGIDADFECDVMGIEDSSPTVGSPENAAVFGGDVEASGVKWVAFFGCS